MVNTALPITLLNFDGTLRNQEAILNWSTANEINNRGFEVQKSIDGQNFTSIGFMIGAGNSSNVNIYHFSDLKVVSGSNFYRLKQVDFDGKFIYSKIITITFNAKPSIQLFPNPAKNYVLINLKGIATGNYVIRLIDVDGKILSANTYAISAGMQPVNIPLNNYSSGIYFVEVRDALNNVIGKQRIINL